jgi:biopolymer transport protein ExbD
MNHASVRDNQLRSPLRETMILRPSQRRGKRKIVAALILTSLVDAFSIMLLYLLCNGSGNGSTLELVKSQGLPVAIKSDAIHSGTLVRVDGGQYFISTKPGTEMPVAPVQLAQRLQELRASLAGKPEEEASSLIIQANRDVDFALLAPVIRAGSITGFHNFKFAVLQEEGAQ